MSPTKTELQVSDAELTKPTIRGTIDLPMDKSIDPIRSIVFHALTTPHHRAKI
jgi:hypothetical protein